MKKSALIGFGNFGQIISEKLIYLKSLKYVCGRKISSKLINFKKRYKIEICSDFENILEKVDLVVISTPSRSHYKIVKKCLMSGKDVFIEKPITTSLIQAKKLFALAKEKKVNLYVDDVFLFREEYKRFKKIFLKMSIKKIIFSWEKMGTFTDTILNTLVYHDMYLLIDLLGSVEIENLSIIRAEDPLVSGRADILNFTFNNGEIIIEAGYDRTKKKKMKRLEIHSHNEEVLLWDNDELSFCGEKIKLNKNDALLTMFKKVINQEVDFKKNNETAQKALYLINEIKRKL